MIRIDSDSNLADHVVVVPHEVMTWTDRKGRVYTTYVNNRETMVAPWPDQVFTVEHNGETYTFEVTDWTQYDSDFIESFWAAHPNNFDDTLFV